SGVMTTDFTDGQKGCAPSSIPLAKGHPLMVATPPDVPSVKSVVHPTLCKNTSGAVKLRESSSRAGGFPVGLSLQRPELRPDSGSFTMQDSHSAWEIEAWHASVAGVQEKCSPDGLVVGLVRVIIVHDIGRFLRAIAP